LSRLNPFPQDHSVAVATVDEMETISNIVYAEHWGTAIIMIF
jgi:hypothetical protein